jgi:YD repeat-containing protein
LIPAGRRWCLINAEGRFTYAYDAAGRLANEVNAQGDRTTLTYDAAGQRTRKDLADGGRTSFTYDAAGRLTSVADFDAGDAVISSFEYQCDNVGNRTSVLEAGGERSWMPTATRRRPSTTKRAGR